MNNLEVKVLNGVASFSGNVDGRPMSYTGAWTLQINRGDLLTTVECLVPGTADSLSGVAGVMGDWSTNDYAIYIQEIDANGDSQLIDHEALKRINDVIEGIRSGELMPTDNYGELVRGERLDKVLKFLEPRINKIPEGIEGKKLFTKIEIEMPAVESGMTPSTKI